LKNGERTLPGESAVEIELGIWYYSDDVKYVCMCGAALLCRRRRTTRNNADLLFRFHSRPDTWIDPVGFYSTPFAANEADSRITVSTWHIYVAYAEPMLTRTWMPHDKVVTLPIFDGLVLDLIGTPIDYYFIPFSVVIQSPYSHP
jgi:hypothetical protein